MADDASSPAARAGELEAAQTAIEGIASANIRDADRLTATAARLDTLGNVSVCAAALPFLVALALAIAWVRRSVVRPMLALSDAMDRFGKGELDARGTPDGALELRRMTAHFNAMGDALARRHRARLAHLAGVAHDLRNPLSALLMSTSLVDPDRLPEESGARRTFLIIQRQVGRLDRMVGDLLDATQIEAGQLALELEQTDLRSVVEDVAELFVDKSSAHEIRVDLPDEPLVARCDALRIEQTITNLLSNAIKYSPRGGVVRVVAARNGDRAEVVVSDQGIGIEESELDQIWKPFQRVDVSAETIRGAGLGLWTARRIIDSHHGSLTVRSVVGRGSTFTLSLPLVAQPSKAAGAAAAASRSGESRAVPAVARMVSRD